MQIRPIKLSWCRVVVTLLALVCTDQLVWADAIQFSKPVVAIAVPPKEEVEIIERRAKTIDFSGASAQQPVVQQPQPQPVRRVEPREREEAEEISKSRLHRDSQNPFDVLDRPDARDPFAAKKSSLTDERIDSTRALAPVNDFSWDPRRQDIHTKNSVTERRSGFRDDGSWRRDDSAQRKGHAENNEGNALDSITGHVARQKEKPTPARAEYRAAFERLINPTATISSRPAGSLEPVTESDIAKPAPPPVVPPGFARTKSDNGPIDPTEAFNIRHVYGGSEWYEREKKYASPTSRKPGTLSERESLFQTPLMRQPTVHEFPARKF
jgi:hypothetical protein